MNEEGSEKKDEMAEENHREEIHSNVVRAGKRTYFFDVKATRRNDYYLTITESKKRFGRDGKFFYEKHKLFLYKEDFDKFAESLNQVIEFIREANPQMIEPDEVSDISDQRKDEQDATPVGAKDFTSVEFEDLDDANT
ncbi:MAG: PUR family DNA/RNA-binding protein [Bacteroidales bacterium]|nr:PUR family DNA/RNA-binding protein [Bacteroidales bacterium]